MSGKELTFNEKLGRTLRKWRGQTSSTEVAAKVGVSKDHLLKIERGEACPSIFIAASIVWILGKNLADLEREIK